jgi:aminopeptidase N
VYEKGAEVVRMIQTLIGREGFRARHGLYFQRHDGQAVTCEDFVAAMQDASGVDLTPVPPLVRARRHAGCRLRFRTRSLQHSAACWQMAHKIRRSRPRRMSLPSETT